MRHILTSQRNIVMLGVKKMGKMINTVCGTVSSDDLGIVLAHEHIVFGFPGFQGDLTLGGFDREELVEGCVKQLNTLKQRYGLKTLVDATPNECGRDALLLQEISRESGVNIICSTGYYIEAEGAPSYFNSRQNTCDVPTEIFEMFKEESYVGIEKTDVKAGVIKLCSGLGYISDYEKLFFHAAAKLARQDRNIRIITHTSEGTCAVEQADLLISAGVHPAQIQIGHFCGCLDSKEQKAVLAKGVYVGFDRMGMDGFYGKPKDEVRYRSLMKLLDAGYEDRILLSHDYCYFTYGRKTIPPRENQDLIDQWTWSHLFKNDLPNLRKMGVSEKQCEKFMKRNPSDFYGGRHID